MIPAERIIPIIDIENQLNALKKDLYILELRKEVMLLNIYVDFKINKGDQINPDGSITPAKTPDPELPIEEKNIDV